MTSPKISILVPVYNTAPYLRRCLDSLCAQTYQNLEIICVNDGSTDDSSDILAEYEKRDSRIIVISQKNQGLSAARNTAYGVATGEWIAGVDSDDYIAKDTYEKLVRVIEDDIDIIWYDIQSVSDTQIDDDPWLHSRYNGKQQVNRDVVWSTNCLFWNKLWRKSFIDAHNVKFPVGLRYEDAYFYFVLAPFARNIYFLQERLHFYWQRAGSIMQSFSPKGEDHLKIAQLILQHLARYPLPDTFGETAPTRYELDILLSYTHLAKKHTPKRMHKSIDKKACKTAELHKLIQTYPEETEQLRQNAQSRWVKLFYKKGRNKTSYRLFGIPVITVKYKNEKKIVRFLGIKITSINLNANHE